MLPERQELNERTEELAAGALPHFSELALPRTHISEDTVRTSRLDAREEGGQPSIQTVLSEGMASSE